MAGEYRSGAAAGTRLKAALLPTQASQSLTIVLIAPVVPQIAAAWGGAGLAQAVVVAPFLGITVGGLLSGAAIRRFGLRPLALMAACAYAAGGAIAAAATVLPVLLAGAALLGFGGAFLTSALAGVTSLGFDGAERARLVGLQSATANALNVTLGLAGAALAERLGWRAPFGVFAAFGAVMLLLILGGLPRDVARGGEEGRVRLLPVLALVWPICLAAAAAFAIATAQSTEVPFLLQAGGITTATERALVTACLTGCSLLGSLTFGFARARLGERGWIAAVGACGAAGWLLFAVWAGGHALAFLAAAIIGFALGILVPLLFESTLRAAPGAASGQGVGLLGAAFFLGSFASPVLTAPLTAAFGRAGLMAALAVVTIVLAGVAVAWPRRTRRT